MINKLDLWKEFSSLNSEEKKNKWLVDNFNTKVVITPTGFDRIDLSTNQVIKSWYKSMWAWINPVFELVFEDICKENGYV